MSEIKKYCEGIDCSWCGEKEPCIYKIANELQERLTAKEQAEQKLVNQIQTICDFINSRPETFKGINGSVDKIITDYAERKEQECERLKEEIKTKTYHWEQCTKEILKGTKQFVDRMEKAERTLAEIEKLAIQGNVYCVDYNVNDCEKCIKQADCKTTLFKQILQKM